MTIEWLTVLCLTVTAIGCMYNIAAALATRRFCAPAASSTRHPSITVLKPLRGSEPALYANLASFCDQNYDAPVQILFGVQSASDTCLDLVRGLIADRPEHDLQLVVDPHEHGSNAKVSNLINMASHAKHDVIIVSDSDIRVEPDYLREISAMLHQPGVGLVTCMYRGQAAAGNWSRLAAMAIDYQFFPSVMLGVRIQLARPCFGSTIALRRRTLKDIGGFAAFANHLADDNMMGEAVRQTGMQVAIANCVVTHMCGELSAVELIQHELRWARTIRAVDPWGFIGSVVTYPLPFAFAVMVLSGFSAWALATLALTIVCRQALRKKVYHALGYSAGPAWLLPLRDLLSFAVFISSFLIDVVRWRGRRYRVRADGTLVPIKQP